MVRVLALAAVIGIGSARAELQLNPEIAEYDLDGMKFKQLAFPDGDKRATYQPPPKWEYYGSDNQLTLHPPAKLQAEATVTRISAGEPSSFDDESIKRLTAAALALLPKESTGVTVLSREKNPFKISGRETFQVVLSYKLLGQTFRRSVLFLNRDRDQLRFQLVAREADFNELQSAFRSSLCSWQNL
jgi:hypothetical protein